MNFEFDDQEAVAIINLIGKTPTDSGYFSIWTKMLQQYQSQKQATEETN